MIDQKSKLGKGCYYVVSCVQSMFKDFRYPWRMNLHGNRSGDRAGHEMSSGSEMTYPGNNHLKKKSFNHKRTILTIPPHESN